MQISTLAIFAVTTVVMTITDIVTTNGKMGGVDVFWYVMEDRWGTRDVDYDSTVASALKQGLHKCLRHHVFDFGTTSDDRQARFGYGCAKYAVDGNPDAFVKFGTDDSSAKQFCHGEFDARYNNIDAVLSASRDFVFSNARPNATLVSIVIAGNKVTGGSLNPSNRKFEEDGNVLFVVKLAIPVTHEPVGNVPDNRNLFYEGCGWYNFVENFQRAICRPRISVVLNRTECVVKPGETRVCHRNVNYMPEVKRFEVICQKYPLDVTVEDCTCKNETTPVPETTTAKTETPETTTRSGVPSALIACLVVGIIVAIVLGVVVIVVVMIRRREQQRRILATKMVVGNVTKSQMGSAFGGKSQMSRAQTQPKKGDQSQKSRKTQMSKSQMSKTLQQKSQASKSQVPQKLSRMSKSPSSKVKVGKSQLSRSPSSKVGKSQMGKGSKMSKVGKSQMGKGSKMSPK